MNNINMNVNGVNPAAAMNAMANGTNGISARNATDSENEYKTKLNTYIYDYFLKNEQYDVARALRKSTMPHNTTNTAPPRKAKGADDGGEDSKDDIDTKKPHDLPYAANVPTIGSDNSFLLDWFQIFWEMWLVQRPGTKNAGSDAYGYMQHTKTQNKLRQDQQSQILRQPGLMPGGMPPNYQNMMRVSQQGMMPGDMARRAQQNNMRNMNPQQQMMLARHQQQMLQQQQMEREGSGVDMNGRPRSPSSGENAPSPSKRPRIEGSFPGQQAMANGRFGPGMPDPSMLSTANFNTFQQQAPNIQKRALDAYSQSLSQNARQNMPQGMNGAGGQMMQPGIDQMEFYGGTGMRPGMAQNGNGQGSSNHALQDYQMQLMLLEQQNKKRLLMARQEQDGSVRPDQAPGMPGQQGFPPNMSPSGSRNGPSPNPSEQMKRGTPKMNQAGLPGSPMPADMPHGRNSPGAMNFNGAMSLEMMQQMEGMKGMPMAQNGMRPPSSHPNGFNGGPVNQQHIEAIRQAQAQGRAMPNGANWPQGPQGQAPGGVPQAAPSQNGQMGTPRAGNAAMPPPQNVPAANANNANNNNANGRPASPAQQPAAASTPQTSNKPAPSKKKTKENNKQPRKKNTTTAATPSADNDNPPPPTPATPITPVNAKSFAENNKNNANPAQATTAQANANVPAPAPAPQMPQPQDANNMLQDFGDINGGLDTAGMGNLTFGNIGSMDTGDVLENFDFDAFLESGDNNDLNFESLGYGNFDGVETALGEP